jgi:hypothetical protein
MDKIAEKETLLILEIDAVTGEQLERPMTEEEILKRNEIALEIQKNEADALAAQQAREASIRKMAEASGLTEAEIEALF